MSLDLHREAERLMAQADAFRAQGRLEDARELYRRAAEIEDRVIEHLPADLIRTRGIIAVSAVTLMSQAGAEQETERLAFRLLSRADLPEFARTEIFNAVLEAHWGRSAAAEQRRVAFDSVIISLRGEAVRAGGLIPVDLVLLKLEQFKNYAIRVAEWSTGRPPRDRGEAEDAIKRACTPIISPASVGSYQFELRLETPVPELFPGLATKDASPDQLTRDFMQIIDTAATAPESMGDRIEDVAYQDVFLKMVRNIVPTGKRLAEIELVTKSGESASILTPQTRRVLERTIRQRRRATQVEPETTRHGVLRALHLDDGWLILVEGETERKCFIGQGMLDDVVGPLVNRHVVTTGQMRHGQFYVTDISETGDEPSA
jgi:hypothetical protein